MIKTVYYLYCFVPDVKWCSRLHGSTLLLELMVRPSGAVSCRTAAGAGQAGCLQLFISQKCGGNEDPQRQVNYPSAARHEKIRCVGQDLQLSRGRQLSWLAGSAPTSTSDRCLPKFLTPLTFGISVTTSTLLRVSSRVLC